MKRISLESLEIDKPSTVFIGENGGGKSTVLRQLLEYFNSQGRNIIAISNCINDKLDISSRNVNYMSAKQGESIHKEIMYDCLSKIDENISRSLSRVLNYCGYIEQIGVEISWGVEASIGKDNYVRTLFDISKNETLIWIPIDSTLPNYKVMAIIKKFFSNIHYLIKNSVVLSMSFFLKKEGQIINFNQISSGEASQISTLAFIASNLNNNSVILVDEPENSLHPKWQRDYINNIDSLFYLYEYKLFISTHSPLMINNNSNVYEVSNFTLNKKPSTEGGIEKVLWQYFDIVTPENEFLTRYLTNILDQYKDHVISSQGAKDKLYDIRNACIDVRQVNVIDDLILMIEDGVIG
ncbi:AAA family ATPase [Vibrio harveyi]|uniref:AAA family ATPase n=1 Tax=Vibrio harveyi TaxID=669 RepID=UPI0031BA6686